MRDAQPDQKSGLTRAIDVNHDRGIVASKVRDMDNAFQIYMVSIHIEDDNLSQCPQISLQNLVANMAKQTQDDLAQFRQEFQEEGMCIISTTSSSLNQNNSRENREEPPQTVQRIRRST